MSISTSSIISQNWKQSRCPAIGECINKLWRIHNWNVSTVIKEMNYQCLERHEGILNVHSEVKEVSLKSRPSDSNYKDHLEETKLHRKQKIRRYQSFRRKGERDEAQRIVRLVSLFCMMLWWFPDIQKQIHLLKVTQLYTYAKSTLLQPTDHR